MRGGGRWKRNEEEEEDEGDKKMKL